jgi:hypothetical protein
VGAVRAEAHLSVIEVAGRETPAAWGLPDILFSRKTAFLGPSGAMTAGWKFFLFFSKKGVDRLVKWSIVYI